MRLPAFVCLLARLLKNAWMDLDDYMSTDVGIWRNRLTFEPDLDHSQSINQSIWRIFIAPLKIKFHRGASTREK